MKTVQTSLKRLSTTLLDSPWCTNAAYCTSARLRAPSPSKSTLLSTGGSCPPVPGPGLPASATGGADAAAPCGPAFGGSVGTNCVVIGSENQIKKKKSLITTQSSKKKLIIN